MNGISTEKRRARARIEADVADFLARGGKIKVCSPVSDAKPESWRDFTIDAARSRANKKKRRAK